MDKTFCYFMSRLLSIACLSVLALGANAKYLEIYPDKELMVPVDGGKVYVRLNGVKHTDAIPVVFIHGGPGGTHNGFVGITDLADERMVILYDQLDSGKSARP